MRLSGEEVQHLLSEKVMQREQGTLQQRLYQAIKNAVIEGKLPGHAFLPGARLLGELLGVSRNTAEAALERLAIEGFILRGPRGSQVVTLPMPLSVSSVEAKYETGKGNRRLASRLAALPPTPAEPHLYELMPGVPALNAFPIKRWRRLMDEQFRYAGGQLLAYGSPCGEPILREAVAAHLTLTRGIRCSAHQVIITEGSQEALELCVALFTDGGDLAWLEDPGYRGARSAMAQGNLRVCPIPVDEQGIAPTDKQWREQTPDIIYISPAHQYPGGVVMSISRRLELLNLARQYDTWLIEDDYDSEFRHQGEPLAALQGLDVNAPVLHIGTFSKTLFPALRIGFLVLPAGIASEIAPYIGNLRRAGHQIEQRTLAAFIHQGDYSRHLAAMRRLYRERQQVLREAISRYFTIPHQISLGGGGMHLTLKFEAEIDDRAIVHEARKVGLGPGALSDHYLNREQACCGLVLGYGNTEATRLPGAVARLAEIAQRLVI
ncbi:GntR family transcriptional regulator [Salmonella enterica subsp. enterica serovar Choleraesuis]|nr:GntR family transcriptional regulator [Salmonella enterica subsp. enterica serovar Choleraesuis]